MSTSPTVEVLGENRLPRKGAQVLVNGQLHNVLEVTWGPTRRVVVQNAFTMRQQVIQWPA